MTNQQHALVEIFLASFKFKLGIWGILFRSDRKKNTQTLSDLEITIQDVKEILIDLTVDDYSEGPLPEVLYGGAEMWVFGKFVKNNEIYIKITIGAMSNPVICISFHIAEFPMKYPLKT